MTSPSTKGLDPKAVEKALVAFLADHRSAAIIGRTLTENIRSSLQAAIAAYLAALPGAGEEQIAKAICRETCAFKGEPACFEVTGDQGEKLPWPPETCDEPGCVALAMAVRACLPAPGGR